METADPLVLPPGKVRQESDVVEDTPLPGLTECGTGNSHDRQESDVVEDTPLPGLTECGTGDSQDRQESDVVEDTPLPGLTECGTGGSQDQQVTFAIKLEKEAADEEMLSVTASTTQRWGLNLKAVNPETSLIACTAALPHVKPEPCDNKREMRSEFSGNTETERETFGKLNHLTVAVSDIKTEPLSESESETDTRFETANVGDSRIVATNMSYIGSNKDIIKTEPDVDTEPEVRYDRDHSIAVSLPWTAGDVSQAGVGHQTEQPSSFEMGSTSLRGDDPDSCQHHRAAGLDSSSAAGPSPLEATVNRSHTMQLRPRGPRLGKITVSTDLLSKARKQLSQQSGNGGQSCGKWSQEKSLSSLSVQQRRKECVPNSEPQSDKSVKSVCAEHQEEPCSGDKLFLCSERTCSRSFVSLAHLKSHVRTHTKRKALHSLKRAGRKSLEESDQLQVHFRLPKRFPCSEPGSDKTLSQSVSLRDNVKSDKGARPYPCLEPGCNKGFRKRAHLVAHIRTHTGEKPYQCSVSGCGKAFNQSSSLVSHLRTHVGGKPFQCLEPGCGKAFSQPHSLRDHKRTHTGNLFHCTEPGCAKAFSRLVSLHSHIRTHTRERPFLCSHNGCGKTFRHPSNLRNHVRTHTGEKPYCCCVPGCNKAFSDSSSLKTHTRAHTGEKPYHCSKPGCNKAFSLSQNLKKHIKTQHAIERLFYCSENGCDKVFSQSRSLAAHRKIHIEKVFHCSEENCDKSYSRLSCLKLHLRLHTGQRTFHCEEPKCNLSFLRADDLQKHARTHTEPKPLICTEPACGKSFLTSRYLQAHAKTHAQEKLFQVPTCNKEDQCLNVVPAVHKRTHTGEKLFPRSEQGHDRSVAQSACKNSRSVSASNCLEKSEVCYKYI